MIWALSIVGYCFIAVLVGIYFYRNCNKKGVFGDYSYSQTNHVYAAFWGGMFWFFGIWVMLAMMLIHLLEDNDVAQEARKKKMEEDNRKMKDMLKKEGIDVELF